MRESVRHTAIELVANAFEKTGVIKAVSRWNRREGGIILAFHEISPAALSRKLTQVAEQYTFVSLSELVNRLAGGKSTAGLVAITFDDGFKTVIESAVNLADSHHWPMTFFLPTRYIDTQEPYWFHELKPLLESAPQKQLSIDHTVLSLVDQSAIAEAFHILSKKFCMYSSDEEIDNALRHIRAMLFESEERPPGLRTPKPISWHRVRELSGREDLSFESHSVNHLALSRLTEEAVRMEMERSRSRIEEMTGRKVAHFCYPYGGPGEIGAVAPRMAQRLFSSAVTLVRGRCGRNPNLAFLPRIALYEQDSEPVVALKVGLAR